MFSLFVLCAIESHGIPYLILFISGNAASSGDKNAPLSSELCCLSINDAARLTLGLGLPENL